jgi:DNA-directed RNA polymerase II subunit RPB2
MEEKEVTIKDVTLTPNKEANVNSNSNSNTNNNSNNSGTNYESHTPDFFNSPEQVGPQTPPNYGPQTPAGTPPNYGPQTPAGTPPNNSPKTPPALPNTNSNSLTHNTSNPNTLLSKKILEKYFSTFDYPFTRHHLDSFDQFISQDMPAIIKSNNPLLILKELIPNTNKYMYKVEIFIGGEEGKDIYIGTPTLSLQKTKEVRLLFPNEARLRNLTYASTVYADVIVKVTMTFPLAAEGENSREPVLREYKRMPLFQMPIPLHSRYCVLHGKPATFLKEAGECPKDQGGYFIVGGAEKVLVTTQEGAFNTFYAIPKPSDPKVATNGYIVCLSPTTRKVKMVGMNWVRSTETLQVTLPFVRKPVPLFAMFRALGVQSDHDILSLIYPDLNSSEAKQMIPLLLPSIAEANPFFDTYSAIQYIKAMTKAASTEAVYDIIYNQTFIHLTEKNGITRAHFLAECVRKFMRVHTGIDSKTDKDDIRFQRCHTAGILIRMLFSNAYSNWLKLVRKSIDDEYAYNTEIYKGEKFMNIFSEGNTQKIFNLNMITEQIMRGFKGKWITSGSVGGGDEQAGVIQALSRLSYLDFMSHCRRVVLNFDTTMKLTSPRQLHTSQYGYFCTNETPGGSSIGITKNFSLMTIVSISMNPDSLVRFMFERGWILPCSEMRNDILRLSVPVFVNNGIVGYTMEAKQLVKVLKMLKWTGCLPATTSIGFSIRNRNIFIFTDEGRPCRPLIHLGEKGYLPKEALTNGKTWRNLILGSYNKTETKDISSTYFTDPLVEREGGIPITDYIEELRNHVGVIEYVDPYEQNECYLSSFAEQIEPETTHLEIHPSTILSIVNGMVPFANYNQSPRNQLSCSQSKQGLSMYATNFQDRYDNTANILCYGEAPLVRTMNFDVLGEGSMPYGHNIIMAIMPFHGFNRDDGIIFNLDSFQRGLFRNMNYRSYSTFEEVDRKTRSRTVIANPLRVSSWTDLKPGYDYSKLDERGIIKEGELVDENTILVAKYIEDGSGKIKDASLTPQVWTSGRVESVLYTVNNLGHLLVKVRITQDRTPELGDKFSTRHGQKGTIGMMYRAHDMPRTASGIVPDMVVNPHCIPSRMTVAQLLEMLFGKICWQNTMVGDATTFTSDASAAEAMGRILEGQFGMEKTGNELMYDGESGVQIPTTIFMGPIYGMRLKHMVEDKWNARAEGRKEKRTHQPTGGRGAQGGLRIGEMESNTLIAHGLSDFLRESMMERADKSSFRVCNGCGTIPIYNEKQGLFVCSLCDGPVGFIGSNPKNIEILPTANRSLASSSVIEMPYATKLLTQELETFLNMGLRFLTSKQLTKLKEPEEMEKIKGDAARNILDKQLPDRIMPETRVPEYREIPKEEEILPKEEDLVAMGLIGSTYVDEEESGQQEQPITVPQFPMVNAFRKEQKVPQKLIDAFGEEKAKEYVEDILESFPNQGAESILENRQQYIPGVNSPPYNPYPTPPNQTGGYASYPQQMNPITPVVTTTVSSAPMMPNQQMMMGGVPQVMMTQQPIQFGGGGSMAQEPILLNSPVPNGPPTFVVNTGTNAMAGAGYMEDEMRAARGIPVMGSLGMRSGGLARHTTPRARAMSPKKAVTFGGQSLAPGQKVMINKIG